MTRAVLSFALPPLPRTLLAGAVLVLAAATFARHGTGGAERVIAEQTAQLAEALREDAARLRGPGSSGAVAGSSAREPGAMLRAAQAAAGRAGARVIRLAARPREEDGLEMELGGPFPALLRAVAELELLGAGLGGLQLRPGPGVEGERVLTVAILPPSRRTERLEGPYAQALLTRSATAMRDPFAPIPDGGARVHDLSARHRLTGVTRIGDGWMATIDGADYEPGDTLAGRTVARIDEDGVWLAADDARYLIRFAQPSR